MPRASNYILEFIIIIILNKSSVVLSIGIRSLGIHSWLPDSTKWLSGQDSPANAEDSGDSGLIPGSGRFPGEGNGNTLQYSCLENSIGREAWRVTVHGAIESDKTEGLSMHARLRTTVPASASHHRSHQDERLQPIPCPGVWSADVMSAVRAHRLFI